MVDITAMLAALAPQRPLYHSEADFQHAIAWEIHKRLPEASVRLEVPVSYGAKVFHVDIWVAHEGDSLAIELKYKTRGMSLRVGEESYSLRDQSAQDLGRYDFVKDIQRLEQMAAGQQCASGWAILLTNDSAYWTRQRDVRPVDEHFRLHEGRVLQGTLSWGAAASQGTTRGREEPLSLKGSYPLHWRDYSRLATTGYSTLRYLAVRVE